MDISRDVCLQGIFRGLGDTRTPLTATVAANGLNILLDPIFIFVFGWGAPGAALATVLSQVRSLPICWELPSLIPVWSNEGLTVALLCLEDYSTQQTFGCCFRTTETSFTKGEVTS